MLKPRLKTQRVGIRSAMHIHSQTRSSCTGHIELHSPSAQPGSLPDAVGDTACPPHLRGVPHVSVSSSTTMSGSTSPPGRWYCRRCSSRASGVLQAGSQACQNMAVLWGESCSQKMKARNSIVTAETRMHTACLEELF